MAELVNTFDFDIQPTTLEVPGELPPGGEAEVNFTVSNTSLCRTRALVIVDPVDGPEGKQGLENWSYWLTVDEPREYDYQPQGHHTCKVKIKLGDMVVPGQYHFRLLLVDHDNPDSVYMASDKVAFNVAIPPRDARGLVIGMIVLVALVLIGGIVAMRLIKPPGGLDISFKYDGQAEEGILEPYTLEITNKLGDIPAKNVVMEYIFPEGVEGAWADVKITDPAEPAVTRCGSTDTMLRCALGKIQPGQKVIMNIYALPGPIPGSKKTGEIVNEGRFSLHWMVNTTAYDEDLVKLRPQDPINTIVKRTKNPISGAAIPAVDVVAVGLPAKITLAGWNNNDSVNGQVVLKYALPKEGGMRFAHYDKGCSQQPPDYFTLTCKKADAADEAIDKNGVVRFNVRVIPMQPFAGYAQTLRGGETKESVQDLAADSSEPLLSAENNQLVFNGVDEWAQLGTSSLPATFTVEVWVNPNSLEDDQALIGVHRHEVAKKDVINKFLVGYYNGSINVNVMGDYHNLDLTKPANKAGPFHLAIVVENGKNDRPLVTAYKDGEPVNWLDCPKENLVNGQQQCLFKYRINETTIGTGKDITEFDWVIGQDWDADGSGIIPSDFYHGAISDVRIFGSALTEDQVKENMYLPLRCVDKQPVESEVQPPICYDSKYSSKKDLDENKYNLIGWWPLAPTKQALEDIQGNCLLPKSGLFDMQPADGCRLENMAPVPDADPMSYDGARSGGAWENAGANFGYALAFSGSSAAYLDSVLLSEFEVGAGEALQDQGSSTGPEWVPVTISAWVYVDTVPSQRQTILTDSFGLSAAPGLALSTRLIVTEDGHVAVDFNKRFKGWVLMKIEVRDEKPISVGRWIHYAAVFWFDKKTGALNQDDKPMLLFRDGQKAKARAEVIKNPWEEETEYELRAGLHVGGLETLDKEGILEAFMGRIDEVRIWNWALYDPEKETQNNSPEINLWRRSPGIAFDEYAYWSFDDRTGQNTCFDKKCPLDFILPIDGPSWVPNDLGIDYAE